MRLSVNRPLSLIDRPSRSGPTGSWLTSVGRPGGRSFLCLSRPSGRPGHVCARRAHRSTEQSTGLCPPVDQALSRPASMPFSLPLSSGLCAISFISFLLSPYERELWFPIQRDENPIKFSRHILSIMLDQVKCMSTIRISKVVGLLISLLKATDPCYHLSPSVSSLKQTILNSSLIPRQIPFVAKEGYSFQKLWFIECWFVPQTILMKSWILLLVLTEREKMPTHSSKIETWQPPP